MKRGSSRRSASGRSACRREAPVYTVVRNANRDTTEPPPCVLLCTGMTASPPTARILVIDDEPQIHRFLGPALEAAGYAVERAETATEGLRLAASRAPDLVLLDLGLPDLDGQEVLARLRGFSPVPVVVLSARDREADKIA